jgi:hypothetical protein
MALKATVHEKCPRCGMRSAVNEGTHILRLGHNDCPAKPPGPAEPPVRFMPHQVNFVRGEWTAEQLQAELDTAFAEIAALKDERGRALSKIRQAQEALNDRSSY